MEEFWDLTLSRSPKKIITAYSALSDQDRINVVKHLRKMSSEEGWQLAQKKSAETAIKIIALQFNGQDQLD